MILSLTSSVECDREVMMSLRTLKIAEERPRVLYGQSALLADRIASRCASSSTRSKWLVSGESGPATSTSPTPGETLGGLAGFPSALRPPYQMQLNVYLYSAIQHSCLATLCAPVRNDYIQFAMPPMSHASSYEYNKHLSTHCRLKHGHQFGGDR